MVDVLLLAIIGITFIAGIIVLVFFARRASKGFKLVITKDGRNPDVGERVFFMIPDKKSLTCKIYKNKFSFKVEKTIPFIDPLAYRQNGKTIYAMQGITGDKNDDSIVPYSPHIVSSATALSNVDKLTEQLMAKLKELGLKAPEGHEIEKLLTEGFTREREITNEKGEKVKEKQKIEGISPKWLISIFGIPDVSNGSVLLLSQRSMIEASHRITNEFRNKNLSAWAKHQNLIILGIVIFMLFIAFIPVISSTLQYQQGLSSATTAFVDHLYGLAHPANVIASNVPLPT